MGSKSFPLVELHWIDSYSDSGWFHIAQGGPASCYTTDMAVDPICTIGFLIEETDDVVTIVSSLHHHPDGKIGYLGPLSIPKCAVVGRWEIRGSFGT